MLSRFFNNRNALGMLFMLIGLGVRLRSCSVTGLLLLVILFQMLTAPVGAHMVARTGYHTGKVRAEDLAFDELTGWSRYLSGRFSDS